MTATGNTSQVLKYFEERPGEPAHMMDAAAELGLTRQQVAAILTRQTRRPRSGLTATGNGYYMFDPAAVSDTAIPGHSPDFYYVGQSADGHKLYADRASKTVYAMVPVKASVVTAAVPPAGVPRARLCMVCFHALAHHEPGKCGGETGDDRLRCGCRLENYSDIKPAAPER